MKPTVRITGLERLRDAAKRVGRTPARLRQLLALDEIPGAQKIGRDWYIPDNWKLPPDTRKQARGRR